MNILFIGDPHLKITRFDLAKQFLIWVDSVIAECKPDVIVNLGDTFDTHAVIRSEVMSEFMQHVYKSLHICPYVYLVGNHDMYKPNDSKYHALSHLVGKINNFIIIDRPQDVFDITFVPYIHDAKDFPLNTRDICVAHQSFKGANYGDFLCQDGVDPNLLTADIVISGHIHKKQVLGKVIYPGSPFSQDANDVNEVKGLLLFNTKTYNQIFIESPLPQWRELVFNINKEFSIEDLHLVLSKSLTETKHHWLINITGPKLEISNYLLSKRYKDLIKGVSVRIKANYTDKEKKNIAINSLSIDNILLEYINKVYNGSLDRGVLLERALMLIKAND